VCSGSTNNSCSLRFLILMSVFPCLQKAMPMRLLTVGKKRSRGTQLLVEEYKEKLGHYCEFEDTLIRSNPKLTRYDPPTLKPVVRYIYNRRPSLQCAYQYVRHQSTAYRLSPASISHLIYHSLFQTTLYKQCKTVFYTPIYSEPMA
jgi:hypothetical protein